MGREYAELSTPSARRSSVDVMAGRSSIVVAVDVPRHLEYWIHLAPILYNNIGQPAGSDDPTAVSVFFVLVFLAITAGSMRVCLSDPASASCSYPRDT